MYSVAAESDRDEVVPAPNSHWIHVFGAGTAGPPVAEPRAGLIRRLQATQIYGALTAGSANSTPWRASMEPSARASAESCWL